MTQPPKWGEKPSEHLPPPPSRAAKPSNHALTDGDVAPEVGQGTVGYHYLHTIWASKRSNGAPLPFLHELKSTYPPHAWWLARLLKHLQSGTLDLFEALPCGCISFRGFLTSPSVTSKLDGFAALRSFYDLPLEKHFQSPPQKLKILPQGTSCTQKNLCTKTYLSDSVTVTQITKQALVHKKSNKKFYALNPTT